MTDHTDAMLNAADLTDRTDRLILADVMTDAGREAEADLLRDGSRPAVLDRLSMEVRERRTFRVYDTRRGCLAGTGTEEGGVVECWADLPDEVYGRVHDDLAAGSTSGVVESDWYAFRWEVA